MIQWPERARRAFGFLFRPYNDIDVFVEDSVGLNVYEALLERILQGKARVTRVTSLGDRSQVLRCCAEDQLLDGRPRLYLIDADLDLLVGERAPKLKHLYRLAVYASENLVFSEQAIVEVAFDSLGDSDRSSIRAALRFSTLIAEWAATLVPLFTMYAAARVLSPEIQTVSVNVMQYCSHANGHPSLDAAKVAARIEALRGELEAVHGEERVRSVLQEVESRIDSPVSALGRVVSGKTYLLPLVFQLLKHKANYRGNLVQLKMHLARYTDLNLDAGLVDAVLSCSCGIAA